MTEAPSPNHVTATRFSPRILKARAWPTAIGTIAPMWLTIATMPRLGSAKCTLASRPRAGPSTRPMYWARIRHGSSPRMMCTAMSRCVAVATSSGRRASPVPTAAPSFPRPV